MSKSFINVSIEDNYYANAKFVDFSPNELKKIHSQISEFMGTTLTVTNGSNSETRSLTSELTITLKIPTSNLNGDPKTSFINNSNSTIVMPTNVLSGTASNTFPYNYLEFTYITGPVLFADGTNITSENLSVFNGRPIYKSTKGNLFMYIDSFGNVIIGWWVRKENVKFSDEINMKNDGIIAVVDDNGAWYIYNGVKTKLDCKSCCTLQCHVGSNEGTTTSLKFDNLPTEATLTKTGSSPIDHSTNISIIEKTNFELGLGVLTIFVAVILRIHESFERHLRKVGWLWDFSTYSPSTSGKETDREFFYPPLKKTLRYSTSTDGTKKTIVASLANNEAEQPDLFIDVYGNRLVIKEDTRFSYLENFNEESLLLFKDDLDKATVISGGEKIGSIIKSREIAKLIISRANRKKKKNLKIYLVFDLLHSSTVHGFPDNYGEPLAIVVFEKLANGALKLEMMFETDVLKKGVGVPLNIFSNTDQIKVNVGECRYCKESKSVDNIKYIGNLKCHHNNNINRYTENTNKVKYLDWIGILKAIQLRFMKNGELHKELLKSLMTPIIIDGDSLTDGQKKQIEKAKLTANDLSPINSLVIYPVYAFQVPKTEVTKMVLSKATIGDLVYNNGTLDTSKLEVTDMRDSTPTGFTGILHGTDKSSLEFTTPHEVNTKLGLSSSSPKSYVDIVKEFLIAFLNFLNFNSITATSGPFHQLAILRNAAFNVLGIVFKMICNYVYSNVDNYYLPSTCLDTPGLNTSAPIDTSGMKLNITISGLPPQEAPMTTGAFFSSGSLNEDELPTNFRREEQNYNTSDYREEKGEKGEKASKKLYGGTAVVTSFQKTTLFQGYLSSHFKETRSWFMRNPDSTANIPGTKISYPISGTLKEHKGPLHGKKVYLGSNGIDYLAKLPENGWWTISNDYVPTYKGPKGTGLQFFFNETGQLVDGNDEKQWDERVKLLYDQTTGICHQPYMKGGGNKGDKGSIHFKNTDLKLKFAIGCGIRMPTEFYNKNGNTWNSRLSGDKVDITWSLQKDATKLNPNIFTSSTPCKTIVATGDFQGDRLTSQGPIVGTVGAVGTVESSYFQVNITGGTLDPTKPLKLPSANALARKVPLGGYRPPSGEASRTGMGGGDSSMTTPLLGGGGGSEGNEGEDGEGGLGNGGGGGGGGERDPEKYHNRYNDLLKIRRYLWEEFEIDPGTGLQINEDYFSITDTNSLFLDNGISGIDDHANMKTFTFGNEKYGCISIISDLIKSRIHDGFKRAYDKAIEDIDIKIEEKGDLTGAETPAVTEQVENEKKDLQDKKNKMENAYRLLEQMLITDGRQTHELRNELKIYITLEKGCERIAMFHTSASIVEVNALLNTDDPSFLNVFFAISSAELWDISYSYEDIDLAQLIIETERTSTKKISSRNNKFLTKVYDRYPDLKPILDKYIGKDSSGKYNIIIRDILDNKYARRLFNRDKKEIKDLFNNIENSPFNIFSGDATNLAFNSPHGRDLLKRWYLKIKNFRTRLEIYFLPPFISTDLKSLINLFEINFLDNKLLNDDDLTSDEINTIKNTQTEILTKLCNDALMNQLLKFLYPEFCTPPGIMAGRFNSPIYRILQTIHPNTPVIDTSKLDLDKKKKIGDTEIEYPHTIFNFKFGSVQSKRESMEERMDRSELKTELEVIINQLNDHPTFTPEYLNSEIQKLEDKIQDYLDNNPKFRPSKMFNNPPEYQNMIDDLRDINYFKHLHEKKQELEKKIQDNPYSTKFDPHRTSVFYEQYLNLQDAKGFEQYFVSTAGKSRAEIRKIEEVIEAFQNNNQYAEDLANEAGLKKIKEMTFEEYLRAIELAVATENQIDTSVDSNGEFIKKKEICDLLINTASNIFETSLKKRLEMEGRDESFAEGEI